MKLTKKLMALAVSSALVLSGCSGNNTTTGNNNSGGNTETKKFKIGITQIAEHSALDAVAKGFKDEMAAQGVEVEFIEENAQGDVANANLIAQKFVQEKVDLIFAIATPAAQAAKTATSDIPIVFSAVTDPVRAELVNSSRFTSRNATENTNEDKKVEDKNISGTSDGTPIKKQLEIFKTLKPDAKKIGIVYNTAEVNSVVQVEQSTKIAAELGLEIVPTGITSINELPQAVDSLVGKVDGIYAITDNLVANGIRTVADKANEHKILTIGAERGMVEGGLLLTDGISYYELGKQSARIAKKVLVDKVDISTIDVELGENTEKVVNEDTAAALGIDLTQDFYKDAEKIKTTN